MTNQSIFKTKVLSSLAKVFADEALDQESYRSASALLGETFSFQIAYTSDAVLKNVELEVNSTLADRIKVRSIGLVPSEFPCFADHDADVLRSTPGLYPDPLYDIGQQKVTSLPRQWRSLWVSVTLDESVPAGLHSIQVTFRSVEGEVLATTDAFELIVIPMALPPQKLIHTEWFHVDCLATYYGDEVFSEAHWTRIEQYANTMIQHGMNMILTPLFTPPLDTVIGGERPTVQLVDVEVVGECQYTFGFDRLTRWVTMCKKLGMTYYEFSHLFTQWGAKHAPKIIATVNGEEQQIFGWDTDAISDEYRGFLDQFLPTLDKYLKEQGIAGQSWFHISDEPLMEHLEGYGAASKILRKHLADYPIMDALSDFEIYKQGHVKKPIPANDHIEPFLENEVPNLWVYYCCAQDDKVSNRFNNMPSARNRVIGLQMYKFGIEGFLHWGLNFWYTQFSLNQQIDPFRTTDAGHAFPSGDSYLVYPGADGPIESIRLEVFYEGLQDLRALTLLEQKIGREQTIVLMEEGLSEPLTFSNYPRGGGAWLLATRERINQALSK